MGWSSGGSDVQGHSGHPRPSLKIYKRTQESQGQVLDVRLAIGPHWREGLGQDISRVQLTGDMGPLK